MAPEEERYRLRGSPLRGGRKLVAKPGGELARLDGALWPTADAALRIDLAGEAAGEPRLLLLLLAACAAMLLEAQLPRGSGGGTG